MSALGSYLFRFLTCYVSTMGTCGVPASIVIDTVDNGPEAPVVEDTHQLLSAEKEKSGGMILPFERTKLQEYIPGHFTDVYTYFQHYLHHFDKTSPQAPSDFADLPLLHIWPNYFEA